MTIIKEYNENTSIHGLKYITENGRYAMERVFWCIIVFLAVVFGTYLTSKIIWRREASINHVDN